MILNSEQKMNTHHSALVQITGIVQGVGFRPFVYRLAKELQISGSVRNDGSGVVVKGCGENLPEFLRRLRSDVPPLARIDSFTLEEQPPLSTENFTILHSNTPENANAEIPADICLCEKCAAEIVDPRNRRFHYPFTNCTDCGPRYTIVSEVPYDRPKTSMNVFPMCEACQREYDDPSSRRFHAQPNACPLCGPQLELDGAQGEPLTAAAEALAAGKIVAIRGLGGYHLAVDACSKEAVARLRLRKHRPAKPLAIMCQPEHLGEICEVKSAELELLNSPQAPIVLFTGKRGRLAANIAPHIKETGVMRPSTPLHSLLLAHSACPPFLVMTSGNHHGNPICRDRAEAKTELSDIADLFLHHNREILTRVDDSVARIAADAPRLLRRSRGYTPNSIHLARDLPPLLACGASMKNNFCLAEGHRLIPGQHIGKLENPANFDFYVESITHLQKLYHIEPQAAVCDLHPDLPSTRYAEGLGLPLYRVQHHHAHAAAVMAEHDLEEAIAIVLDGTGLGEDGTIWGGELLHVTLHNSKRLAHLSLLPMPGGDKAAIEPWRMGLAALHSCDISRPPAGWQQNVPQEWQVLQKMLGIGLPIPQTSSAGRLFDAVASLLGVCQQMSYEGEAAMELETLANSAITDRREWLSTLERSYTSADTGNGEIYSGPFLKMMLARSREPRARLARDFHAWLAAAFAARAVAAARMTGVPQIVLSGGCMQNRLLLEALFHLLREEKMEVFAGELLPMNDGGLAAGQALVGGLMASTEKKTEAQ